MITLQNDIEMHCMSGWLRVNCRNSHSKGFLHTERDADWRVARMLTSMLTRCSPGSDKDVSRSRANCRSALSEML